MHAYIAPNSLAMNCEEKSGHSCKNARGQALATRMHARSLRLQGAYSQVTQEGRKQQLMASRVHAPRLPPPSAHLHERLEGVATAIDGSSKGGHGTRLS